MHEDEPRSGNEAGFTLLEMVIGVVVLTLILGATAAAIASSMTATSATKERVNGSNDAQLVAAFLTRDAQAAGGTDPNTGVRDPNLGVTAGAVTGCTAPGTSILGLKWIDRASSTTYVSVYSYVATATGGYQPQQLLRTLCKTGSSTESGTSVLANNVVTTATGGLSVPVAWCDTPRPTNPVCPAGFSLPQTVSMGISVNTATRSLTPPFSFILTAALRPQSDSVADPGGTASTASLLLLGNGGNCVDASSAAFHLTIFGSSMLSNCNMAMHNSTAIPYGPVYVTNAAACADFDTSVYQCIVINGAFLDPYQALIDKGQLTRPVGTGPCTPGPGRPPNVLGGRWQPGTYLTDPQTGGTEREFAPGEYVFCNGLTGAVTANLGGTLFYFEGGAYTCNTPPVSNGCQKDVSITPPASGMYEGLAWWQPRANNATVQINKGIINITGTVYAPSTMFDFKNGTININQLIALGIISNPGNPDVYVGPPLRIIMANQAPPYSLPQFTSGQTTYPGAQAVAVDGTGFYNTWTISGGGGLQIDQDGLITGVPSSLAPGDRIVRIGVKDSAGEQKYLDLPIHINPPLTITGSMPKWTVNVPVIPSTPLSVQGGSGTGYSFTPMQIAPGLNIDASGRISGTPTLEGLFTPTITVTDSLGDVTSAPFAFVVYPRVSVVSITSTNANGAPAQGDSIQITFSSAIDPSSVCSAWTAGANTTSGIATLVTLTRNPSGNDSLAVTDSACAFHVFSGGLLDLGQAGYATTVGTPPKSAVFGAPSPNCGGQRHCSSVSINAANTVLTITLGDLTSGTVGTVLVNPGLTYTPDTSMRGAGGASILGTASNGNPFF